MAEVQTRHHVPRLWRVFKHPVSRIRHRLSRPLSNVSTSSTSTATSSIGSSGTSATTSGTTSTSTTSNSSDFSYPSDTLNFSVGGEARKSISVQIAESRNSKSLDGVQQYTHPRRRKPQRPPGEPQRIRMPRMNEVKLRIVLEKTFGEEEGKKVPIWMQQDHYEIWPPRPLEAEDFAGFRW